MLFHGAKVVVQGQMKLPHANAVLGGQPYKSGKQTKEA